MFRHIPTLKESTLKFLKENSLFKLNHFPSMFQEELFREYLEAIIDDKRDKVKVLLDRYPELLIIDPKAHDPKVGFVIVSKLTWQKFHAENGALMAAKRKQIEMLKIMIPYYDKLEQTEAVKLAKAKVLSAWPVYTLSKSIIDEDKIVIPHEYLDYAKSLINVFVKDSCQNPEDMLSNETESALATLFNILLPKQAVKLDDYLDVELFLLTCYRVYWHNFQKLNWNQRNAFCIRVIGLVQSVLSPEMAQIFCEDLVEVTKALKNNNQKKISPKAMSYHSTITDESFYHASRESTEGIGMHFFCSSRGFSSTEGFGALSTIESLECLYQTKTASLTKLLKDEAQPEIEITRPCL